MVKKVKIKKGASHLIKSSTISSKQAEKIFKAIVELQNTDLSVLQKTGKVRKLKIQDLSNIYTFRAGISERILFTPIDNKIMIHDIIDVRRNKSMISLISSEEC